jgi:phage-related protein
LPKVSVVFYCDEKGNVPFLEWFGALPEKVQDKCLVRIERLKDFGYELKRPEADYLKDDIHELRFKHQSVNYRVLYYFHGKQLVVLSHGFTKQRASVPDKEIIIAVERMKRFKALPSRHTFKE